MNDLTYINTNPLADSEQSPTRSLETKSPEYGSGQQDNETISTNYSEKVRQNIPQHMQEAQRWLLWRLIRNSDPTKKPRKVPYYANGSPRRGQLDSPDDLARLVDMETAIRTCERGSYAGLGFALGPDGNGGAWQGIDLDELDSHPELRALVPNLPGYVESSPSKNGFHAIGYGPAFQTLGSNGSGVEAYSSARFFTVTGDTR